MSPVGPIAEVGRRDGSPRSMVVTARGEIDALTIRPFAEALSVAAAQAEGSLIVDLERVVFMDVKGYAAVVNADRKMRERGGEVLIVCSRSTTRRVFTVLDPRGRLRLHP